MSNAQAIVTIFLLFSTLMLSLGALVRLYYLSHEVDVIAKRLAALDKDLRG